MDIANAAPMGVLAFGVSCFVSGLFFMGVDNDPPEATTKTIAHVALGCCVSLFIVSILFILGSKPVNSTFAMWAAAVFGFYAYIWWVLGWTLLTGGDLKPVSSFMLYASICSAVFMIHSYQLGAISFFILFIFAVIGTFAAWLGIRGWWGPGTKVSGACFFICALDAFYIGLWEMMTVQGVNVLIKKAAG